MILEYTPKKLMLFLADLIIMYGALYLSIWIRVGDRPTEEYFLTLLPSFLPIFASSLIVYYIYGLYDKPTLRMIKEIPGRTAIAQAITTIVAVVFFYIMPNLGVAPKTILFLYVAIAGVSIVLWRRLAFGVLLKYKNVTAISLGSGSDFRILNDELERNPHTGITLLSAVDLNNYQLNKIPELIDTLKPDAIVADLNDDRMKPYFSIIYEHLYKKGMLILDFVDIYEETFNMIPLDKVNHEWIFRHINKKKRQNFFKYLVDIIVSVPVLLIFLVLIPFVYIAVKLEDGGKIFFRQRRVGKFGEVFELIKIRTMTEKIADETSDSDRRVTRVGKILRRTRIDELPQIWNVLKGDISLVGPRPETDRLANEYNQNIPFYNVRHMVRPGLTGWAQIEQRSAPKFGIDNSKTITKLAYDMFYLKHQSIILDASVMLKTIKVILSREGS